MKPNFCKYPLGCHYRAKDGENYCEVHIWLIGIVRMLLTAGLAFLLSGLFSSIFSALSGFLFLVGCLVLGYLFWSAIL